MKYNFLILVIALFSIAGCSSKNDGQECTESFFNHIIQEQYDSAVNMLDNFGLENKESTLKLKKFRGNSEYGELISFEKNFGFSTSIKNGITTVVLPYELNYSNRTINSQVTIINRGDGYKIYSID